MTNSLPIDHILFGVPDLQEGINYISKLTGVEPVIGGKHLGLGTHNALLGLGEIAYLEIIAPDPDQDVEKVWMGLDKLVEPTLFRWAAYTNDLIEVKEKALAGGINLGEIKTGSRKTLSGELLEWQLTDPNVHIGEGLVPFFIDWGPGGNPTAALPKGCKLLQLTAEHSEANSIQKSLRTLQLDLEVRHSNNVRLTATIETPVGNVILQ